MKKITLLIAFLLSVITAGYGQTVASYAFSQSTGNTYTEITGGTSLVTCTACTDSYDSNSYAITLPSAFPFNGSSITNVVMRVDGSLIVGSTTTGSSTTPISATTTASGIIAPFGADLRTAVGTGVVYELRWEDTGTNYVFQWKNASRWLQQASERLNFQVVINKTTGVINFNYGSMAGVTTSTSYQPQVGLRGAANTDFNSRVLTDVVPDATPSWDDTVNGGINSSTIRFTSTAPAASPVSGLQFTFTPNTSCNGTPNAGVLTTTAMRFLCSGSAPGVITVVGTSNQIAGISLQWEESTNNGTSWANATAGTGAATASYTPPNYAGTPIQYRLKTTCSNSSTFATSPVTTVTGQVAPTTQASALTLGNAAPTTFTVSWTNGNGARRIVFVSTSPIVDPVSGPAIPSYTVNTAFANTGQQAVYEGTSDTSVTITGLTCGTPYYVKVFEYNRCGSAAPYDMYFNVVTGGTNALTVNNPATAVLPVTNNFTGFTGSNLGAVVPGWYEAAITTAAGTAPTTANPTGFASDWTNTTLSGTTTAKINLYTNTRNAWIISPKMAITANTRVKFKAAITDFAGTTADAAGMQGTDDKVRLMLTTDCGATWTELYAFTAANTTTLTNALQNFTFLIPASYVGQTVQIGFQATDGPADDAPDYDFHIAGVVVELVPNCDKPTLAATTAIGKTTATINWTVPTAGIPTGYEYVVSTSSTAPTGAGTATTGTSIVVNNLTPSTVYYVFMRTVCGSDFSDWTVSSSFTTLCNYPDITSTTPGARCGIGSVTLSAASTGSLYWFTAATGSTYYGNGTSISPQITGSTNYYVSSALTTPASTVPVGAGATTSATYSNPLYSGWSNNHTQHLITANELIAAGIGAGPINSVALDVTAAGTLPMIDLSIKIGASSATAMTAFVSNSAFATVYTNASYLPTAGVNTFTFTTPYNWDGISNIVLEFCHGNSASTATMSRTVKTDNTSYVSTIKYHVSAGTAAADVCSTTTGANLLTYSVRPQFIFNGVGICLSPRQAVAATVNSAPAFTLSGNPAGVCSGQTTAAVTITAGAADYNTYVWTPSTGVSGSAAAGWTFNPAVSTTYTLQASQSSGSLCNANPVTVLVTINSLPTVLTTPATLAACAETALPLTASGGMTIVTPIGTATTKTTETEELSVFGNRRANYKIQTIYTAAELTAAGVQPGNINSIAYFVDSVGDGDNNPNYTIKIGTTTNSAFPDTNYLSDAAFTPVYGPATHTHIVGENVITFTAPFVWNGASNIVVQLTYDGADDLYNAQTFYTDSGVNTTLYNYDAPTATTGTATTKRVNTRFNASFQNPVTWSPATNLYTNAAATTPYVAGTNAATVYFKSSTASPAVAYTATATTPSSCTTTATVNVSVTSTAAPTVPAASQDFCNAGTVADLVATGTAIKWYAAATGGTSLAPTTALVNGTIYYASQTADGCESFTRTALTANVNVVSAPAISNDQQVFCNNATIADLLPNGAEIKWYAAATGGTALVSTDALVSGTTYYASQTVNGCEGLVRGAVAATVLVSPAPSINDIAPVFCNSATVADLIPNDASIKWYTAATGGTILASTEALVSGTSYFASQTIDGCEGLARTEVTATINATPAPTGDSEQEFCDSALVGDLTATGNAITWYDAETGGSALTVDTALIDGTTYYAAQIIDGCEGLARLAVTAVIHNVVVDAPADVNVCTEYVLPALTSGAYFTEAGGQGIELAAGSTVTETTTIYVYAQEGTDVVCSDENSFVVTVANVPAPTGDDTQTIEANPITDAFVSDLQVDATTGTITWYASLADAQAGVNPLTSDTPLVQGATYYATQTLDTCTSVEAFAVTVDIVLDRETFDIKAFTYYPNPVKDVLNLSYSSEITSVTVFNLLGQKVIAQQSNATDVKIDMSSLADGAYVVNVTSGATVKTIKVIKKQ